MGTAASQRKWRDKHRFVKSQLNVMARKQVHRDLLDIAATHRLRGKGEAVAFAVFMTRALMQRAEYDAETAALLRLFVESYGAERDAYSA